MEPQKPVYSTSNISDVKKPPGPSNPLYGALRGPNANEMSISRYYSDTSDENSRQFVYDGNCKLWNDFEPLYLHHGER